MTAPTVLVVEDNPQTRKLLRITLESHGCGVREAGDAASALAQLEPAPDVIVQDLLLPDMDGLKLLAQVRANPGTATTPVIAVSGFTQQLFGAEAADAGFAERLRKPVEPSRLLAALQPYLDAAVPADVPAAGGRRVLVADDSAIQRKLTVLRLRDAGYEVLEAADGQAALELARAERPDAILTDVLMPRLDGFELCREIRADPAIARVPIVLASSVFVEREDRELADRAGADGFVTREPDLASILEALGRALGGGPTATPVRNVAGGAYEALRQERVTHALLDRNDATMALEAQLEEKDAQLAVLAGISEALSRAEDPSTAIEGILARCLEATGLAGIAFLTPEDGGRLAVRARLGDPPAMADVEAAAASDRPMVRGDAVAMGLHRGDDLLGVAVLGTPGHTPSEGQVRLCGALARQISQALSLARTQAELVGSREQTVERLATAIALRDGGTAEHTRRMSAYCAILGRRIGMAEEESELLRVASAMHDIGKVATPDTILLKPGRLTDEEFEAIKRHTLVGHEILAGSGSPLLELAARIALSHHERWDGTGYPEGLRGEEIPLQARIAAIADVFDALISDRPYRAALSIDEAVAILEEGRGRHFDPALLDAFIAAVDSLPT